MIPHECWSMGVQLGLGQTQIQMAWANWKFVLGLFKLGHGCWSFKLACNSAWVQVYATLDTLLIYITLIWPDPVHANSPQFCSGREYKIWVKFGFWVWVYLLWLSLVELANTKSFPPKLHLYFCIIERSLASTFYSLFFALLKWLGFANEILLAAQLRWCCLKLIASTYFWVLGYAYNRWDLSCSYIWN